MHLLGVRPHMLNIFFGDRQRFSQFLCELVGRKFDVAGQDALHIADDFVVGRPKGFVSGDVFAIFVQLAGCANRFAVRVSLEHPLRAFFACEKSREGSEVFFGDWLRAS